MEITEKLLNDLRTIALEDFKKWWGKQSSDYITEEIAKYPEKFKFTINPKYIKIVSGGSVFGFIVNSTTDKQFKYGDLLKSAGQVPAKNFARGSIFDLANARIRWTGFF